MRDLTGTKKLQLSNRTKDYLFICSLLILPLMQFVIFWLYLNISSIALAFQNEYTGSFSLEHFERFFAQISEDWINNKGIKIAIENTLITAVLRMFVSMPLVVFVSFVLFKKYYGHMFFRIVFYIPGIVGTVITATMTTYILDAIGPVVQIGSSLGVNWSLEVLQTGLLGNIGSARSTYFITSVLGIAGGTILLLTGALQKIPHDIFDAAKLDGVGLIKEFINIVLPCIWSTVGIMWLMTFAQVWGDYSRVMLLTNGEYNTNNFAYYAFNSSLAATRGTENFNYPAAIGVLMTMVIAPISLLFRWLSRKLVEPVEF